MKDSFGSQNNNYHDDMWHISLFQDWCSLILRCMVHLAMKRLDFPIFCWSRGRSATYLKPIQLKVQSAQWVFGLWYSLLPLSAGQWSMDSFEYSPEV